jgi:hypothetical protein
MDIAISSEAAQAIGWFYAATSLMRVVAYAPQVWLVWRCAEGARSVSLMTWGSAALSHLAATVYGMVVVGDGCFTAIGIGNFVGSVAIVWVAGAQRARRPRLPSRRRSAAPAYPRLASTRQTAPLAVDPRAAAPGPIRPADPTTTGGTAAHWRCQGLSAAA